VRDLEGIKYAADYYFYRVFCFRYIMLWIFLFERNDVNLRQSLFDAYQSNGYNIMFWLLQSRDKVVTHYKMLERKP